MRVILLGVLLFSALLYILDARRMTTVARVLAPEISLIGIHNKYFPCYVGSDTPGDTSHCLHDGAGATSVTVSIATLLVVMVAALLFQEG